MARQKKRRSRKAARAPKPESRFLPADPPARNRYLLSFSIILLLGWMALLAWLVARIT